MDKKPSFKIVDADDRYYARRTAELNSFREAKTLNDHRFKVSLDLYKNVYEYDNGNALCYLYDIVDSAYVLPQLVLGVSFIALVLASNFSIWVCTGLAHLIALASILLAKIPSLIAFPPVFWGLRIYRKAYLWLIVLFAIPFVAVFSDTNVENAWYIVMGGSYFLLVEILNSSFMHNSKFGNAAAIFTIAHFDIKRANR